MHYVQLVAKKSTTEAFRGTEFLSNLFQWAFRCITWCWVVVVVGAKELLACNSDRIWEMRENADFAGDYGCAGAMMG